jgi:hypothetical protein
MRDTRQLLLLLLLLLLRTNRSWSAIQRASSGT